MITIKAECHSQYFETMEDFLGASGYTNLFDMIETAIVCYDLYENQVASKGGNSLVRFAPQDRNHPDRHITITDNKTNDHVLLGELTLRLNAAHFEGLRPDYDYGGRITNALIVYEHIVQGEASKMELAINNPATGLRIIERRKPGSPASAPKPPGQHLH